MALFVNPFGEGTIQIAIYNDDESQSFYNISNTKTLITYNATDTNSLIRFRYFINGEYKIDPHKPVYYDININGFCNYKIKSNINYGKIAYEMGDIDEILKKLYLTSKIKNYLLKAVESNPYTYFNGKNVLLSYIETIKPTHKHFKKYAKMSIDMGLADAHLVIGNVYKNANKYPEMIKEFTSAVEKYNFKAAVELGNYYYGKLLDKELALYYYDLAFNNGITEVISQIIKYMENNMNEEYYETIIQKVLNMSDTTLIKEYGYKFGNYFIMKDNYEMAKICLYKYCNLDEITKENDFKCFKICVEKLTNQITHIINEIHKGNGPNEEYDELMIRKDKYIELFTIV